MIDTPYAAAREVYASGGVNTEAALATLAGTPISLHCWQGDDVGGFERAGATLAGGGIQATGNYPGKARTIDELRCDIDEGLRLIPGRHRLNLHAIYGDFGGRKVDRNAIGPEHFLSWIDWAKQPRHRHGLQPDLLLAPAGRRRLHAVEPSRPRRPPVLDRARHRLPSRIGAVIGRVLGTTDGHQRLDPRRPQGSPGGPPGTARAT